MCLSLIRWTVYCVCVTDMKYTAGQTPFYRTSPALTHTHTFTLIYTNTHTHIPHTITHTVTQSHMYTHTHTYIHTPGQVVRPAPRRQGGGLHRDLPPVLHHPPPQPPLHARAVSQGHCCGLHGHHGGSRRPAAGQAHPQRCVCVNVCVRACGVCAGCRNGLKNTACIYWYIIGDREMQVVPTHTMTH